MDLTSLDWHSLWINATRYAMPRRTYASAEMAEMLSKNAEHIAFRTRAILIRDISFEIARGTIRGIDLPAWERTLEKLKEQQP